MIQKFIFLILCLFAMTLPLQALESKVLAGLNGNFWGALVPIGEFRSLVYLKTEQKDKQTQTKIMASLGKKDWIVVPVISYDSQVGVTRLGLSKTYLYPLNDYFSMGLYINYVSVVVNDYGSYKAGDFSILGSVLPGIGLTVTFF